MKAMICEMCQSNDLVKQDGVYVCQHCGTKYSIEEARKLLGTVRIDKTEETEKLLVLARRARDEQNIENAIKYYVMVLQEDPYNWEAAFFEVYFQAMQSTISNIEDAAYSVANRIDVVIELIAKLEDKQEQDKAIETITLYSTEIANMLGGAAHKYYRENLWLNRSDKNKFNKFFLECSERFVAVGSIFEQVEIGLKKHFPTKTDAIVSVQKPFNKYLSEYGNFIDADCRTNFTTRLAYEIKQHDTSYVQPTVNTGGTRGCYVATAVYGSYDCPQVWTLRRFRDNILAKTWYGRAFIRTYYTVSPTLVKWFGKTEWFKNLWRPTLDRMVKKLNGTGVEDTPYDDRVW